MTLPVANALGPTSRGPREPTHLPSILARFVAIRLVVVLVDLEDPRRERIHCCGWLRAADAKVRDVPVVVLPVVAWVVMEHAT